MPDLIDREEALKVVLGQYVTLSGQALMINRELAAMGLRTLPAARFDAKPDCCPLAALIVLRGEVEDVWGPAAAALLRLPGEEEVPRG